MLTAKLSSEMKRKAANTNLKDRKLKYFMIALGVGADRPVASLEEMFHDLKERIERGETLTSVEDIDSLDNRDRFTSEVIDRMKMALSQGLTITIGNLSRESNLAEMTLCTEIFEIESEKFFINAYENC